MKLFLTLAALAAAATPVVAGVAPSATEIRPALIGAQAPAPTLRDGAGEPVETARLFGEQPTILVLYRGGW